MLGIDDRGSSGYGKTFDAADDGKHGREPLWDVVAARQYLQTLAYVDPDRIGIIGGSYGGYMVLYVVFADEGHGFAENANQIEGYGKILVFLDTYLKGKVVAPSSDEDVGTERVGKQPDARDGK